MMSQPCEYKYKPGQIVFSENHQCHMVLLKVVISNTDGYCDHYLFRMLENNSEFRCFAEPFDQLDNVRLV